ncbi:hypothetical protein EVAR_78515_1 [Eumeta japonica]|uniref:Uncharacterized protein n=1 Tax=Eumeta variegata TaxID=151549 RepID=A0A4C1TYB9_EUMVA|nr:hypothetical protein EVAR_78515_1 [Eumeta japonica]
MKLPDLLLQQTLIIVDRITLLKAVAYDNPLLRPIVELARFGRRSHVQYRCRSRAFDFDSSPAFKTDSTASLSSDLNEEEGKCCGWESLMKNVTLGNVTMSHRTRERFAECLASLSHSTMIGLRARSTRELVHSLQMYCKLFFALTRAFFRRRAALRSARAASARVHVGLGVRDFRALARIIYALRPAPSGDCLDIFQLKKKDRSKQ